MVIPYKTIDSIPLVSTSHWSSPVADGHAVAGHVHQTLRLTLGLAIPKLSAGIGTNDANPNWILW